MGGRSISSDEMRSYYSSSPIRHASSAQQVFKSEHMLDEFNPAKMKLPREACDSAESPHSRGIIFAEDVTGSMGRFLFSLIKEELPELIKKTYETVSYNPHIMFMGVGDVYCDDAPLQVTQFETDLRMIEQLQKIWLEKGGGGNDYESYILPWYFAGNFVKMDCFDKRGEKGFLFTFGDEDITPSISSTDIKRVFGDRAETHVSKYTNVDCYEMASKMFNCYHIILHGGGYDYIDKDGWKEVMGTHVCDLKDHKCLAELVTTILAMYEGLTKTEAIAKIDSSYVRSVVEDALIDHEEVVEDVSNAPQANVEII